jgi:hypothetical protein
MVQENTKKVAFSLGRMSRDDSPNLENGVFPFLPEFTISLSGKMLREVPIQDSVDFLMMPVCIEVCYQH